MFLLEWTASDLLLMALGAVLLTGMVVWLVPSTPVVHKRAYSEAETTAYDHQIPRYFLFAALALMVGSVHMVVKNLPGFWLWLWEAGYGGHLFRDLSNSHIIIVGGGTVLLTGITWYLLPRLTNRPLYSNTLASASLWFTVIGVFGFYLAWLVLGLVEGAMVRDGWEYMAAKEAIGAWHRVPTRITASIMGAGYWTYVLNVMLTVGAARHIADKPQHGLTRFVAVAAAALFAGTVQGVLQVLPANADWIHLAGKFGQYVDPISHAHVNLVTGMMVSLAAFLFYFGPRLGGKPVSRRQVDLVFWSLAAGSLLFYLAFLLIGLVLGNAAVGSGGLEAPFLVPFLSRYRALILAAAGCAMLAGFWVYFIVLWRQLGIRRMAAEIRSATPAGFWYVSSFALLLGTFQGLLQVLPATVNLFTGAEEVPNIHAQLNMVGGVLLALIGIVYLLLPELTGQAVTRRTARVTLAGIGGGIAGYYLVTLATGLIRWSYMLQGDDVVTSATRLAWVAPALLVLTASPLLVGCLAFGAGILRATRTVRAEMAGEIKAAPAQFTGPIPAYIRRTPRAMILGMELAGSLFGWPGLGWLYAGQALPGIALMLAGPSIAWALLPMLFSPIGGTILSAYGWSVLLIWLPVTAGISTLALAYYLHRTMPARVVAADSARPKVRIPRPMLAGAILLLLVLLSVPAIPLLGGVPDVASLPPLMDALPASGGGAYLDLADGKRRGLLKLYAWSFPQPEMPEDSPAINPDQVQSLLISQKGLDDPGRYQLFAMDAGDAGDAGRALLLRREVVTFQKELRLSPDTPLAPGNYLLAIPAGGMFAGREFYYFRVDPAVRVLPPIVSGTAAGQESAARTNPIGATPRILLLLPLICALLSATLATIMGRRQLQRVRPHELAWTIAFVLFALAAGSQAAGDLLGWTPWLARLYYVSGATLVVGWLGLGTWLLLVHQPKLRTGAIWLVLLLNGYALGLASLTPVNPELLIAEGWHALQKPAALTILTLAFNILGTGILVGGALWSAWVFWRKGIMPDRMIGCLLLAGGALAVAAGGSLTRLGHQQYLYVAMTLGVTLMFWGYWKTIQPAPAQRPNNALRRIDGKVEAGASAVVTS